MSRRVRLVALALVASLALGATACASPTEPALNNCEDGRTSDCQFNGYMGSGT
jgi:hypothetical protein